MGKKKQKQYIQKMLENLEAQGMILRQVKFHQKTYNALNDTLNDLNTPYRLRGDVRADILARCVEIGLSQAIKERKGNETRDRPNISA